MNRIRKRSWQCIGSSPGNSPRTRQPSLTETGKSRWRTRPPVTSKRRWNTETRRWPVSPRNLDILVSQASIAQQAKDNAALMNYAAKGGEVCHSIGKQAKPEGMSDAEFASQIADEKDNARTV